MNSTYQERYNFAREIALEAGALIASMRKSHGISARYKGLRNPVTTADLAAETLILEAIRSQFPNDTILSEESHSQTAELASDALWIIDPIDGTVNYARGHHHCAVSIAFAHRGQVQFGVVYCPFLNELYRAGVGLGAFCNDEKLQCSGITTMNQALVATGFPYERDDTITLASRVKVVLENCQDIRRLGACSMDLAWVAAGKLDAYYECVEPWDMAAGALLVKEAGGMVQQYLSPLDSSQDQAFSISNDLRSTHLLASNAHLWEPLSRLLQGADSQ